MGTDSSDTLTVLRLEGPLDAAQAPRLKERLAELVASGRPDVVLDMGAVTRVDSAGLAALVCALKAARARGGDAVLASLTPSVRAVVELTRLHRIFAIFEDADEAVTRLAG